MGELEFDTTKAAPGTAPDLVPGGYMWECPNLITLRDAVTGEDLDILIICPQGLEPVTTDTATHYASSDQCGYIVGKLDGTRFTVLRGFSEFRSRATVLCATDHRIQRNLRFITWLDGIAGTG